MRSSIYECVLLDSAILRRGINWALASREQNYEKWQRVTKRFFLPGTIGEVLATSVYHHLCIILKMWQVLATSVYHRLCIILKMWQVLATAVYHHLCIT